MEIDVHRRRCTAARHGDAVRHGGDRRAIRDRAALRGRERRVAEVHSERGRVDANLFVDGDDLRRATGEHRRIRAIGEREVLARRCSLHVGAVRGPAVRRGRVRRDVERVVAVLGTGVRLGDVRARGGRERGRGLRAARGRRGGGGLRRARGADCVIRDATDEQRGEQGAEHRRRDGDVALHTQTHAAARQTSQTGHKSPF